MSSPAFPVPDLVCADPAVRVDLGTIRQILVFAFATGASQEAFDGVLAKAKLPPSSWNRASFARDLYLDEIVDKCFEVTVEATRYAVCTRYLARVVAEPPRDPRDVDLRRDVLRELVASPEARRQLERIYVMIVRLRTLLCAPRQPSPRGRRIEILRTARELFDLLAGSFEGATSALARLRAFGTAVVAGRRIPPARRAARARGEPVRARPPCPHRRGRRGAIDADRRHPREPRQPVLPVGAPALHRAGDPLLSRLPDDERRGGGAGALRRTRRRSRTKWASAFSSSATSRCTSERSASVTARPPLRWR